MNERIGIPPFDRFRAGLAREWPLLWTYFLKGLVLQPVQTDRAILCPEKLAILMEGNKMKFRIAPTCFSRSAARRGSPAACLGALLRALRGSFFRTQSLLGAIIVLALVPELFAQAPDPQQLFQKALADQQAGDAELAAKEYEDLLSLHPEVTAAHANLGVVLVSLGRFDEAIAQYHFALAEAPDDPKLRLDLGLAYYKKGDYTAAAAEFAALHKDDPSDVRVATLLGTCESHIGLDAAAVELLTPLEAANASNLDLEWALGQALIHVGQTREGLERVQKVADEGQVIEAYQTAANLYLGLTYFDKAKRDAEAVIRLDPRQPKAYVVLGMVADYSGDEQGAAEQFEKALKLDPTDLQARVQLGSVFYTERKLDDARRELNRALTQDPKSYSAIFLLGQVERAQGNLSAAMKDFETAEGESPEWLRPHVELVALYYQMKRPADGAREKEIVDRLMAEERQRRASTRVILPQVPSQ